jgi:hypothetical protein
MNHSKFNGFYDTISIIRFDKRFKIVSIILIIVDIHN